MVQSAARLTVDEKVLGSSPSGHPLLNIAQIMRNRSKLSGFYFHDQ